jgi:threonylcarbamoyladenosine tRNA methylthiotransferase MtaB
MTESLSKIAPGLEVVTFGCRLNAYESEIIRRHAEEAGWSDSVIVNTCAVTAEAERQARQTIRRLRRERPGARILVTGCAAQIDPERFAKMPEIDRVIGNDEKMRAEFYQGQDQSRVSVGDIMAVREVAPHLASGFEGRARAFIEVQQGCDHRCTFCIIPYGRGNSRSVPLGEAASRVAALVESGIAEIVLTGVDLASWGVDLPGQPGLAQLLRRLLAAVPGLRRLRLSSLDPAMIDDELIRLVANEDRLMPHLHLSVQAGDDLILKRMARRHSRAQIVEQAAKLRAARPGIALGADLIAGFPTESEAAFERSLALVSEAQLSHLHVFPYSPRPGTPAARIPRIDPKVARVRAAKLREAGQAQMDSFMTGRIGSDAHILIEQPGFGRCAHYLPVRLDGDAPVGSVVSARLTGIQNGALTGTMAA